MSTTERTRDGVVPSAMCESCGAQGVELVHDDDLGFDSCAPCAAASRARWEGVAAGALHVVGEAVTAARFGCTPEQIQTIVALALQGEYHTDHAFNVAGGIGAGAA